MKSPIRVTIALDQEANRVFEKLKEMTNQSQSEIIRNALKFYFDYKKGQREIDSKTLETYIEMLYQGEHLILDVDHWNLILSFIESSQNNEKFWEGHKRVAQSHGEQLSGKMKSVDDVLDRLEACNFFSKSRENNVYTLVLGSENNKKFIKMMLEEVFAGANLKAEIKEDLTKLRVVVPKL